jgi:PEP-CTERM motif
LSISNDTLTGFAFQVENANPSGLDGLAGTITGTFEIGSYSNIGLGAQEAPVTGTGTMSIVDGSSILSAVISWNTAVTYGPFGALNYGMPSSPANLSNFTYIGTTASVLYQLSGATSGTNVLDFTFLPPESIAGLTQGGSNDATTFSGSFEAIPEPSTYSAILGVGAICFAAWRRRRERGQQF